MPDLNGRHVAAGVAGGVVSIDNVPIATGGTVWWLSATELIFNGVNPETGGPWALVAYDTTTGRFRTLDSRGANSIAAGGGRWAAQAGPTLYASFPVAPGSVMTLQITDQRGGASPDGAIALCSTAACTSVDVYWPDGSVDYVGAIAYGFEIIGRGQYLWDGGQQGFDCRTAIPMSSRRVAILPNGEVWIVGWSALGLVAQLNGAADGYILEPRPIAFYHRARAVDGELVVCWSENGAESPGSNVVRQVDRTAPRVPLVEPPVDPPPVDPPVPPDTQPPDPPDPPDTDPPTHPPDPPIPPPTSPYLHHTGVTMELDGKIVVLRGVKGLLLRPDAPGTGIWKDAQPAGWRGGVFDGSNEADARYRYRVAKAGNRYTFINLEANCLAGEDATWYSGGVDQQIYFKPSGNTDAGDYEQWRVYDGNENGAIEAQIEHVTDAAHPAGAGKKFFTYPLGVEVVG